MRCLLITGQTETTIKYLDEIEDFKDADNESVEPKYVNGIKILNIKAGSLYGYILGVRDRYDYTAGVLSKSMFSDFMLKNGLEVHRRAYGGNNAKTTRDIICLDFDFGSRSYEEELDHLTRQYEDAVRRNDERRQQAIKNVIEKVKVNKYYYTKRSKDEIREYFYTNDIPVRYVTKDKNGNIKKDETIYYRMLYRNSSKAKIGQVMFINRDKYDIAYEWLTMGIGKRLPDTNAKIVEISAYAPLTTSTILDDVYIPVDDVVILKDQDSYFRTMAKVVKDADYTGAVRVIDNDKTEAAKRRAAERGKVDILGNPIYHTVYKKVDKTMKKCVVVDEETDIKNTMWDGMGLVDISVTPKWANGMILLRNHFFKMCGFKTDIQLFFKDWCEQTGNDYETYSITDMFGKSHRLKDIKIITTNNAVKWTKFYDLMGNSKTEAYEYWCDRVKKDGCRWGIVKTDHPSKLGAVQQMSYQMVNTLPCSNEDIQGIARTSIDYVEKLKSDPDEFEKFLRKNANDVNHYEMMADLYKHNHDFANSDWFRAEKSKVITAYVMKLRSGKITVNADNLTICGNPYALLLYSVGGNWEKDPTLNYEEGTIQCYTKRFKDGEYLAAFRSPHNSPNNMCYLHNRYSAEMERYFRFSGNIIAVNCIHSDIQDRGNGLDFDADSFFVTNHKQIVSCAQKCYTEYPTIVNALPESGVTYNNTKLEYARMDIKLSHSKRGIGESSNMAQLAMTYYWTALANGESKERVRDLYDAFIILSVLAQLIIDSSKREYSVDSLEELKRIKNCKFMTPYGGKRFPEFMKYTKDIATTKNGKELPYDIISDEKNKLYSKINYSLVCPMNYLQKYLNKIQVSPKTISSPVSDFICHISGLSNNRQITKIQELVSNYDAFIKVNHNRLFDDDFVGTYFETTEEFINNISKIKIGNIVTFNRLVEIGFGIYSGLGKAKLDSEEKYGSIKYGNRLLNTLYKTNKAKFLSNFVTNI